MAKFVDPGEELDTGKHGYSERMYVCSVHAVTVEWLAERKMPAAQAHALLNSDAWHVFCASSPDGTGVIDDIWLHEDDARHFHEGDEITYHYHRDKIPSGGRLAFIERTPRVPTSTM
jgi:hypothetical protein